VPLISTRESRRAPRLAGSLSRGANTAGTRYSSDIVVECMNERWIDRIVSKCLFVRVEQTGVTAEDITVLTLICYPLSRTSLPVATALPGALVTIPIILFFLFFTSLGNISTESQKIII